MRGTVMIEPVFIIGCHGRAHPDTHSITLRLTKGGATTTLTSTNHVDCTLNLDASNWMQDVMTAKDHSHSPPYAVMLPIGYASPKTPNTLDVPVSYMYRCKVSWNTNTGVVAVPEGSTVESGSTLPTTDGTYTASVVKVDGVATTQPDPDSNLTFPYTTGFPFQAIKTSGGIWTMNAWNPLPQMNFEVDNASAYVQLTDSSPDFVVYRAPMVTPGPPTDDPDVGSADPTPAPEPTSTGLEEEGDSDDAQTDDASIDNPTPAPEATEPLPDDFTPSANPDIESPVIKFGVRYAGWEGWTATINVYPIAQGNGILGTPLGQTVVKHSGDTNATQVTWDELFPGNTKPASGAYFYNIQLVGVTSTTSNQEHLDGLHGTGTSTGRLDTDLFVKNLHFDIKEEPEDTSPEPDGSPISNTPPSRPSSPRLLLACQLVKADGSPADLTRVKEFLFHLLSPQLERDSAVTMQVVNGHLVGETQTKAKSLKQLGIVTIVGFGYSKGSNGGKQPFAPANILVDSRPRVTGIALGFMHYAADDNPIPLILDPEGRRIKEGDRMRLLAFVQIRSFGGSPVWYTSHKMSNLSNIYWIGSDVWGTTPKSYANPTGAAEIYEDWINPNGLNIHADWQEFENIVSAQIKPGIDRWYGMRPKGSSIRSSERALSYGFFMPVGTHWYGARVSWQTPRSGPTGYVTGDRTSYLLPTDRINRQRVVRTVKSGVGADIEVHNNVLILVNKFNVVPIGKIVGTVDHTTTQRYWTPDPSEGKANPLWAGRISGTATTRRWPVITFDDDDPFFGTGTNRATKMAQQSAMQENLMKEAYGFLGVPYGWGGQDYGGKQSAGYDDFTKGTKGTNKVDPVGVRGSSTSLSGYGIDCSGFITEVAYLRGLPITQDSFDYSAGSLRNGSRATTIQWLNVRPGDYAASADHVVYARSVPHTIMNGNDVSWDYMDTLEANPSSIASSQGTKNGRVREIRRSKTDLDGIFTPRRWKLQ